MMQPFLAVPLELPSLITFLVPPLLSQQQAKIRLWIHKGKSGQLRSEGQQQRSREIVRESIAVFVYAGVESPKNNYSRAEERRS